MGRQTTPRPSGGAQQEESAYMPGQQKKVKRDRTFDADQRNIEGLCTVTYRYFTKELRARVKEIESEHAARWQVNLLPDEVARSLMEYAVEAYGRGEVDLPKPEYVGTRKKGRIMFFSLYPGDHPEFQEK